MVVCAGVDVEVGEAGGIEEEEDCGGGDWRGDIREPEEDDGGLGEGDGVVVPDPLVIVNCGLALPESPNTSGEEAHEKSATRGCGSRQHDVRARRRREKLRTDDDVVSHFWNIGDSDLHRARAEKEALGEWMICMVGRRKACVSMTYVTLASSRAKTCTHGTAERGVGGRGKWKVSSPTSKFSLSLVWKPSMSSPVKLPGGGMFDVSLRTRT